MGGGKGEPVTFSSDRMKYTIGKRVMGESDAGMGGAELQYQYVGLRLR